MAPITVRHYIEGDELEISRIYEKCYSAYAGHTPRTPDFWKWFNRLRPEVGPGVLVACRGDRLVGCLTLAKNGEILDPCYDPDDDGVAVMTSLLRAAEKQAIERGFDRIVMNAPDDDGVMKQACESLRMGRKRLLRTFSVSVANASGLLCEVLARSPPPKGTYLLRVLRKDGTASAFRVEVTEEGVSVSEGSTAEVVLAVEESTLGRILFQGGPGLRDWILGKISFSPAWNARRALKLVRSLRVRSKWFVPRGAMF